MELWSIKDKKWVALHLKDIEDEITPEEIHYQILTYVRHIKYPPFVSFTKLPFIYIYISVYSFTNLLVSLPIHIGIHSSYTHLSSSIHCPSIDPFVIFLPVCLHRRWLWRWIQWLEIRLSFSVSHCWSTRRNEGKNCHTIIKGIKTLLCLHSNWWVSCW